MAQQAAAPDSLVQTDANGVISYAPEFFNDSRPTSALDMVQRIPGFSFDGGNNFVRGFAGSGGNVLVDGSAPSTKSISLSDFLRRIRPESIVRIDLIRGGAPGIDMQGQSVIANVIRKNETSTSGSVRVQANVNGGKFGESLRADMAQRDNFLSVSGNLSLQHSENDDTATIRRLDGNGGLRDIGPQHADRFNRDYNGAATLESHAGPGTIIANVGLGFSRGKNNSTTVRTTPADVTTTSLTSGSNSRDEYEASLDYERDIGAIRLHALALKNYQVMTDESVSNIIANSSSNTKTTTGESIVRVTFAGDYQDWLTIETGSEGAINSRYQGQNQVFNGVSLPVPNSNVRIEETRAELFTTANATISPDLRAEVGVRYEASTIKQTGDSNKHSFFSFVKPRAILTYDLTDTTQLRGRVEREVGQLNFRNFVASADLVNGTVTAGNPNLEPERAWVFEGTIDQRFWGKGAITLTYSHSEVEAVNDRIPIVSGSFIFDAPGNIGRGTRENVRIDLSLPLDNLGLSNATFKPSVTWRDSMVTDPLTGTTRRNNFENLISTSFSYTQDFPSLNSTLTLRGNYQSKNWSYRLKELTVNGQDFTFEVNWDWKITPDLLFHFKAENFLAGQRFRDRVFYSVSRADGTISGYETSRTPYDPAFEISLRQSF